MAIINKVILIILCLNTYGCIPGIVGPEPPCYGADDCPSAVAGYTSEECVTVEADCIDGAIFTMNDSWEEGESSWLCLCEWWGY